MKKQLILSAGILLALRVPGALADTNSYVQTNLVSDLSSEDPQILDPDFHDSWGIALRPPGAGGHIWINNAENGTSDEFIGDVPGNPLHQDALQSVTIDTPQFTDHGYSFATGIVYNSASDTDAADGLPNDEFPLVDQPAYINNNPDDPTTYTGPAKFVFVTEDGCINAWAANTATAMTSAPIMIDYSKEGDFSSAGLEANAVFSGVAMTESTYGSSTFVAQGGNHIFATEFRSNQIMVFNDQWQNVTSSYTFQTPQEVLNTGYHVFNVEDLNGDLYVTYADWNATGDEGMEETDGAGFGRVVEYSETGQLIREFNDQGALNAPWGMAIAPSSFGAFGGDLLVANFGDGSIAAFNDTTGDFVGDLDDADGNPIDIDGIWGLTFGNGVSLGGSNTLYFTSGPNSEADGLFGSLNVNTSAVPEPGAAFFAVAGACALVAFGARRRGTTRG